MIMNPIYHEVCHAHGVDPLPDPAPIRRADWLATPSALDAPMGRVTVAGYQPEPIPLERVARLFDVPPEIVAAIPPGHTAELNTDRVRKVTPEGFVMHDLPVKARRPWVATEQLDATQALPIIRGGPQ